MSQISRSVKVFQLYYEFCLLYTASTGGSGGGFNSNLLLESLESTRSYMLELTGSYLKVRCKGDDANTISSKRGSGCPRLITAKL